MAGLKKVKYSLYTARRACKHFTAQSTRMQQYIVMYAHIHRADIACAFAVINK